MPKEYEDVEATLQHDTTPDAPQQKGKWRGRAIDWIAGGTVIAEVLWGLWWLITQVICLLLWKLNIYSEHFAQFYFAWGLGILSVGYLTLILWPTIFKQDKDFKQDNDPRWFHARILSSGIVGGSYAFLLPVVMSLPEGSVTSGGAAALRQAILLATGGLIGLIALGETRRKNDNDREAADQLQTRHEETLKQQKEQFETQLGKQQEQFDANAFKDRKAERRERYTKAVEQLGDEKAPVRMGGVYTLVGLVDEWLEEDKLSEDERIKEGQVIINNLCAYIRSPFTLASHYDKLSKANPTPKGIYKGKKEKFYADKATLDSEADVRLGIIKEIHDRLQSSGKNAPGAWSNFEYDFSGSTFFYPIDLTNSYYAKPINFRGSIYKGWANFRNSIYKGSADFSSSTYEKDVIFSAPFRSSTYRDQANFSNSIYWGQANFSYSIYSFNVFIYPVSINFSGSTYQNSADFRGSTYTGSADFSGSTYKAETKFNDSFYESSVDFSNSTYYDRVDFHGYNLGSGYECLTYEGTANFSHSVYLGTPVFGPTTYKGRTIFSNSIYSEPVNFSSSNTYKDKVDFSGSIYHGKVSIGASAYKSQADFRNSIYVSGADFSCSGFNSTYYFDGSVFYEAIDLHGSFSNKEEPRFTHDYPTCTDPRPEYDKINRHITLFPAAGNDFSIIIISRGNKGPIDISNLPKYCNSLDSLPPEKIKEYNGIINEIYIIKDNLKSTRKIQEKDKYAELFKKKNKELYKWREEVTTIVLQNGVEVSD